jgi:hypothetical protein
MKRLASELPALTKPFFPTNREPNKISHLAQKLNAETFPTSPQKFNNFASNFHGTRRKFHSSLGKSLFCEISALAVGVNQPFAGRCGPVLSVICPRLVLCHS